MRASKIITTITSVFFAQWISSKNGLPWIGGENSNQKYWSWVCGATFAGSFWRAIGTAEPLVIGDGRTAKVLE
jgi:hypothetical protein